ncbi:hypothetical protein LCGC14_0904300 [marine sediment metagenome]|uniref:Uncharacterized protein n=1 Tax=marine sediment metagenome TaxID=412755 RepID=A0A0F9NVF7_9ZZZZ
MAYFKRYFKVDIREPYMGNTLPLKFEVQVSHMLGSKGPPQVELVVVNSEGRRHYAVLISLEMFNE